MLFHVSGEEALVFKWEVATSRDSDMCFEVVLGFCCLDVSCSGSLWSMTPLPNLTDQLLERAAFFYSVTGDKMHQAVYWGSLASGKDKGLQKMSF